VIISKLNSNRMVFITLSTLFTARYELNLSLELRLIFIFKGQDSPCEIFGGQRGTETGFGGQRGTETGFGGHRSNETGFGGQRGNETGFPPIPPVLHTHHYPHVAFT
jgi:hypothetical protein